MIDIFVACGKGWWATLISMFIFLILGIIEKSQPIFEYYWIKVIISDVSGRLKVTESGQKVV